MDSLDDDERWDQRDERIEYSGDEQAYETGKGSTVVQNQPHDEEVTLSDTDSFTGRDGPPDVKDASLIESNDMDDLLGSGAHPGQQHGSTAAAAAARGAGSGQGPAATSQSGQEARPGRLAGVPQDSPNSLNAGEGSVGYNALDYKNLNVSDDIRTLFQYIGRYKPQNMELEAKLKPFIPDYIPAVGGLDEFIKVPRPDGKTDYLGLKVLDEPAARQSDPTVLMLQLRQLSKEATGNKADIIGRVEHGDEQKGKKIAGWIGSIQDIHKTKPPALVTYSRRMPDLEALMQEWPHEMEAFLRSMKMPSGELDLDLKTFTKLICSLLDIPVYENPVESLHVLFSLYLEFKSNPVFGTQLARTHGLGSAGMSGLDGTMSLGPGGAQAWHGARGFSAGSMGMAE